jgi:glycosyltransferase involved in cell wall biosynthesis
MPRHRARPARAYGDPVLGLRAIIPAVETDDIRPGLRNEVARLLEVGAPPLVSVIVRSVGRDTLAQALDSVARQSYSNIEVVVVDAVGRGHPPLPATCGSHPLRLCGRGEPLGRSRAANLGLEEARGKYVIFLDDDDWFLPSHIVALVAALQQSPSADVAYAGVRCVGASGKTDRVLDLPFDPARLRSGNYIPIHAALIRRSAFAGGARFDEALDSFEDWDFWLQLVQRGPFIHVGQASACYRTGGASGVGLTPDDDRRKAGEALVLEKWRSVWSGEELEATIERSREGDRALLARLDDAAKEIERLKKHVDDLKRELTQIKLSLSIRVTAPLRWLALVLRGSDRRGRNADVVTLDDGASGPQAEPPAPPLAVLTEAPLVSVVVPVYNACRTDPEFLRKALASVCSQTYRHLELLIVDDGSTDATRTTCAQFMESHNTLPILYFSKENGGQSSARNFGIARAGGEFVSFLDQDDMFYAEKLERVVPLLEPGVDLVYTDADTIDAGDQILYREIHQAHRLGWPHPKRTVEDVLFKDVFVMPGVMTLRRDLLQRVGGFDESLSGYEDDDLFLRLFLNGTVRYLSESTLKWRMHEENYGQSSRMVPSRIRYWEKLMAEHTAGGTDRRRAHGISRRFFREFLRQAARQLRDGNPVFSENLATGRRIVPHLGLFDRLAFGYWMTTWCRLAASSELVRNLLEGWWRVSEIQQR